MTLPVAVMEPIQAPRYVDRLWKVDAWTDGSWTMKSPTAVAVAASPT